MLSYCSSFVSNARIYLLYMSLYSNARLNILTTVVVQQLKVLNKNKNIDIKESHTATLLWKLFSVKQLTNHTGSVNVNIVITLFCMARWPIKKIVSLNYCSNGSKMLITLKICKLSFTSKPCHRKAFR